MPIRKHATLSRRAILAGALSAGSMLQTHRSGAQVQRQEIYAGLEIVDYRLFPTSDVLRFIVEIENLTDDAIDTPAAGVVLPHLNAQGNFGWATPVESVIHAHSSSYLLGVAPSAVTTDQDWGSPEWMLCDPVQTTLVEELQEWKIEFTDTIEIVGPTHARATVEVTNLSDSSATPLRLQGQVRDQDGRVCGAMPTATLAQVKPGQTQDLIVNLQPSMKYRLNPFTLIDTLEGIDISFSVQVPLPVVNPGCAPALPWNR